jgi:hypothetical protein
MIKCDVFSWRGLDRAIQETTLKRREHSIPVIIKDAMSPCLKGG